LRKTLNIQNFVQIFVIPSSFESFAFYSMLGSQLVFQQIQSNAVYYREVLRRVSGALAAVILIERDIQNPVQRVLYLTMRPYGTIQKGGISGKAADIETNFFFRLAGSFYAALALHTDKRPQVSPAFLPDHRQIVYCRANAGLHTSMVALHFLADRFGFQETKGILSLLKQAALMDLPSMLTTSPAVSSATERVH